jgi:hypothetical protein
MVPEAILSTNIMMLVAAAFGIARALSPRHLGSDFDHYASRLILVGLLVLIAAVAEERGWQDALRAALMPIGAYYLTRTIIDPIIAWRDKPIREPAAEQAAD